jgi:hypothetical protein
MTKIKSIKERKEFVSAHQLSAFDVELVRQMINELGAHPIEDGFWREQCIHAKQLFRDYEAAKFYYLTEPTRDRAISIFIDRTNRKNFREAREVLQETELCELFRALKTLIDFSDSYRQQRPPELEGAFRGLNTDIEQ